MDITSVLTSIGDGGLAVITVLVALITAYGMLIGIAMALNYVRYGEFRPEFDDVDDDLGYDQEEVDYWEERDDAYPEWEESKYAKTMDFEDWYQEIYEP